jgi:anti-sigma B factor antagonist
VFPTLEQAVSDPTTFEPAALRVTCSHADGIASLAATGQVDSTSQDVLTDAILAAADPATGIVVVDLAGVTFLDSCGIRALVASSRALKSRGVQMQLGELSDMVRRTLGLAGVLDGVTLELRKLRDRGKSQRRTDDPAG